MGVCADPGSYRWCQALSRSRSSFATTTQKPTNRITNPIVDEFPIKTIAKLIQLHSSLIYILYIILVIVPVTLANSGPEDAQHYTAILGESIIFNCHVEFPNDHPVPYVLQWDKKGSDLPIYIWYENYPTHSGEGYEGRVSKVSTDVQYGAASLNLTNIQESDQGWYECKVVFLNRDPKQSKNGTWFHLDVHAPPRFSVTPDDIIYVNLGDSIILNCQADGTPTPEILWYKDADPVQTSSTVGVFNDGTELRISTIRDEDIGEYTCIARNGEGQVSHTARVIIAGGAVIMVPPTNQTKLEGEKASFSCEAKAMPGNVTVRWFREGSPVKEVASLETRVTIRKDGSLIINPVGADDTGNYLCEVSNGIGDPQSASAYLNVEYPAKVTFTPSIQYLPFRLQGIVNCYIKSNPPLQYVTWTKDKRLLEPYQTKEIVVMNNGSLLFTRVNENHQGRYTCTPYNAQGTQGSSGPMEILVRKPPAFTIEPESLYQRKVGESVEMHCDAVEAEGTMKPNIQWQRQDGVALTEKNRVRISGGNITIDNLQAKDFGYYECIVSNEVATILSATQLIIEGTSPHPPSNISGKATEKSITLQWMPGYSGGKDYKQDYTIWYREQGNSQWQTIPVTPTGSTQVTINELAPGQTYEFQVVSHNIIGKGLKSVVVTVRTLEVPALPSAKSTTLSPEVFQTMGPEMGPKPGQPRNLTVTEIPTGFLITWQSPLERAHIVKHYTIKYRTDAQWKTLNRGMIRSEETQYLVKNLVGGRTYYFRVLANSENSFESSEEIKFPVPARVKHKAITAGVVGGILFFIVAIILSVCAVKICNKRKRRKQEKEYNMVACRITDARNIAANLSANSLANHHLRPLNSGGGSLSAASAATGSHVPLKKYKQTRISGVVSVFIAVMHWIWPPDRCNNCNSIYSTNSIDDIDGGKNVGHIHRTVDGRFVLNDTLDDSIMHERRNSNASHYTSSDDGGFLSRDSKTLNKNTRTSWRRPLVASTSQLSLHSNHSARSFLQSIGGLLRVGARYQNLSSSNNIYKNLPLPMHSSRPLHINTVSGHSIPLTSQITPNMYTPSKVSRIFSSSPASTLGVTSPWSGTHNFSDLSTVYPGSAERSFPTPSSGFNRLRYNPELPSLRTIQEETRRLNNNRFVPLNLPSPSWRGYYHNPAPYHSYRPRMRWYPRHNNRFGRNHLELLSPLPHLNLSLRPGVASALEASPESRSSSSGFCSKNTSNHQQGSHHSGSTSEWRMLPPYRPPPPPPSSHLPYYNGHGHYNLPPQMPQLKSLHSYYPMSYPYYNRTAAPSYTMGNWLDMISRLNAATEHQAQKGAAANVDVGSVDGHYEFDPATPTPSASTPTGVTRDEFLDPSHFSTLGIGANGMSSGYFGPSRKPRISRYDNIDARVQAMKEEFYAYRKRQAMKRAGVNRELESMC
ncbi:IGSF9B family protein [Megaselia abdita]